MSDTTGIAVFYNTNDMVNLDYTMYGYPASANNYSVYSGKISQIKDGYFTSVALPEPVGGTSGGGYFIESELNGNTHSYVVGIHNGKKVGNEEAVYIMPQELVKISLDAEADTAEADWNKVAPNLLYGSNSKIDAGGNVIDTGSDLMEGTFRRDHIFGREGNDTWGHLHLVKRAENDLGQFGEVIRGAPSSFFQDDNSVNDFGLNIGSL